MLEDFKALTADKTPRRDERPANSATIQSGLARSEIKLGAVRAFALKTLADIYERASSNGVIHIPDHARVQLATANAIHGAIEPQTGFTNKSVFTQSLRSAPFNAAFAPFRPLFQ